jgi:hypothetical protein
MGLIVNDYLSVAEVAESFKRDPKSVLRWIKKGLLRSHYEHGMHWISREDALNLTPPAKGRGKKPRQRSA